jgi:1-acyl-sn-glycerol-3-phosphate acyltransferase
MIPFVPIFRLFKSDSILRGFTSNVILKILGVKLEIIGTVDENANMFIANHQSVIDIMSLEVASKKNDLAWIAKIELFKLIYFGLALSLTKMISLNREDRQGIIKLLKDVKDRVSHNRTVAIFPEGTRNIENKFLPFKSGAGIIANKLKLRVQPIVIVNSAKRFDAKNLSTTSGEVKIIFLESFQASKESDWLQESREKMLKIFLDQLEK